MNLSSLYGRRDSFPDSKDKRIHRPSCDLDSGVGLAAEELAGAGAAYEFAGLDDGAAAGEDGFGGAFDLDAFKHGIVNAHGVGFRAYDFFVIGIEDHAVGVGTNGDDALSGGETQVFV